MLFHNAKALKQSSRAEGFLENVFWKDAASLQENTHVEVWFQ